MPDQKQPQEVLYIRVPAHIALAVRRFARDQEIPISLAIRLLILSNPLVDPYMPPGRQSKGEPIT